MSDNRLEYLGFTARLTKAQADHLADKCTSFNKILMIKYQDTDYEKCKEEITTALMKYVTILCDKYKTGWEGEEKIIKPCFKCFGYFEISEIVKISKRHETEKWICCECNAKKIMLEYECCDV
jgi:hypothetical protein